MRNGQSVWDIKKRRRRGEERNYWRRGRERERESEKESKVSLARVCTYVSKSQKGSETARKTSLGRIWLVHFVPMLWLWTWSSFFLLWGEFRESLLFAEPSVPPSSLHLFIFGLARPLFPSPLPSSDERSDDDDFLDLPGAGFQALL